MLYSRIVCLVSLSFPLRVNNDVYDYKVEWHLREVRSRGKGTKLVEGEGTKLGEGER